MYAVTFYNLRFADKKEALLLYNFRFADKEETLLSKKDMSTSAFQKDHPNAQEKSKFTSNDDEDSNAESSIELVSFKPI